MHRQKKSVNFLTAPNSQLLKDNYSTVTKGYFMPFTVPKGNEQLPARVHLGSSGFSTSSLRPAQTHRNVCYLFILTPFYNMHACSKRKENRSLSTESRSNYSKKPFIQERMCHSNLSCDVHSMLRSYVRVVDPSVCAAKEGSGFTHASRTTSVIPNEVRKKGAGNIAIRLFLPHSLGITHRKGQFYTAAHEGSGPRATCIIILHA